MSRIGKLPINIPAGVTVTFQDGVMTVKGPKGTLSQSIDPSINVNIENGVISFTENTELLQEGPKITGNCTKTKTPTSVSHILKTLIISSPPQVSAMFLCFIIFLLEF